MYYRQTKLGRAESVMQLGPRLKEVLEICLITLSTFHGGMLPLSAQITGHSVPLVLPPHTQIRPMSSARPLAFHPTTQLPTTTELVQAQTFFEERPGKGGNSGAYLVRGKAGSIGLTATTLRWQSSQQAKGELFPPALQMKLVGGNPHAPAEGVKPLVGKVNYLLGSQPAQWQTNLRTFAEVHYHDVYRGVDLAYYFQQAQLEYDFVLAAGADVKRIKLAFTRSRQLCLAADGDLIIRQRGGEVRQHKPLAYQNIQGQKRLVEVQFTQLGKQEIGFKIVSAYDPHEALIIDPRLSFSTFLGGSDTDTGASIAVDATGNIYVAGTVNSPDFPVSATAFQPNFKGGDIFVTKLNPAGNTILYSTFLGGLNAENVTDIAVDASGNVVVTGSTASSDFPTTVDAYQRTLSNRDAFITKLNSTGSALVFSTLLGGSGNEVSYGVALDSANNIYVTGSTTSANYPVTTGVFQGSSRGGSLEAFVTKLNAAGSQLVYSSYLGGNGIESGSGIAVDAAGNAYVTGYTTSSNFPTTAGVFQAGYNGAANFSDAFVAKVNAAGSALLYATYVGGKSDDAANAIAIDTAGNAYIAGTTTASGATNDFPITANAYQKAFVGSSIPGPRSDAFVVKLNASATGLSYATYLGGNGSDNALGIAVDGQGTAFITGSTGSSNFPVSSEGFKIYAGAIDGFIAQLDATGAALLYGSYLGGAGNDSGIGLTLDSLGNAYVVGSTASANFPVLPGALQSISKGGQDVFITALKNGTNIIATNVTAGSYSHIPMARDSIVSVFGGHLATRSDSGTDTDPNTGGIQLPTTLAGTTVKVKDSQGVERLAPLFFVSPNQINYQIPPGTPVGGALATIMAEDGIASIGTIQIVDVAPDLFSADSTGKGAATGNVVRVKAGNIQTEEPIVKKVAEAWELIPIDLGPDLGANTDQVFLVLFGTGIRFRADPIQASASIGGVNARVEYASTQCCFVGVDQVNILIPRTLIGKGEVTLLLTVDGKTTSPLKIAIK